MPLDVAIVGAGLMGGWHARYARKAGARLVGIVDADGQRAAALSARLGGVPCWAADEPWLERARPGVVHVCTPAGSHFEITERSLAAGCSVLVEKPLADGVESTRRLLEHARRAGKCLAPVHQFPFQSGFREVRDRLDSLGALKRVELRICSAGAEALQGNAASTFLLDVLPHAGSLLRALGIRIAPADFRVERHDASELILLGQHGQTSVSTWISADVRPTLNELSLYGVSASAHVDLFHGFGFVDVAGTTRASKLARPFRWAGRQATGAAKNLARRAARGHSAYPGLPELIAAFYRSVEGGGALAVAPEEALESAELCERLSREREAAS